MDFPLAIVFVSLIIGVYSLIDRVLTHFSERKRTDGEANREIEALKERVRVLERITVEEGGSLSTQIAALGRIDDVREQKDKV